MKKLSFITSVLGITLLVACNNNSHQEQTNHTDDNGHSEMRTDNGSGQKEAHNADEIILSPEKAKAAGIQVTTIQPSDFHGVTVTSGKIISASGDERTVVAKIAGVVSLNRQFTEGMAVHKGAAIFTIESAGLQDGDVSRRANIAYQTAKTEYERAQKLVADRIISEKEYLAAKAAYENAEVAYRAIGMSTNARGVTVTAPSGGYVKECMVKEGDYVTVGQPMMTVTQNRHLYLRAEVAERDYAILNRITSAKFKTSYSDKVYDLKELKGRLVSYGRTQGSTSAFIPVTFEFDNHSGIISGSFTEVYLLTGKRCNVINVPVTALTEEQGVYYVYIQEHDDSYRKQEVKLGESDGTHIEITSGLKGGERVVTTGSIHIRLASAANSIPGHTHEH